MLLIYISSVILSITLTVLLYRIEYNKGVYIISEPTIEHLWHTLYPIIIISFVPFINLTVIITIGALIIWHLVKDIRIL